MAQRGHVETVRLELGPRMQEFLSVCLRENPVETVGALATAGAAVICTLGIMLRHQSRISSAPISLLRLYYLRVLWFAPVFGVTAFVSLLCPRAFWLCKMVQLQWEALTIFHFGIILFTLLSEESLQFCREAGLANEGLAGQIMKALAAQGPRKHFGVPPFGCCFRPVMRAHHLEPKHLLIARYLFQQYAIVVVSGSAIIAYAALAFEPWTFGVTKKVIGYLTKFSGFAAIYGLMILYSATHNLLHNWNTTAKFIAIKLVVLLCTFQDVLIGFVVKHVNPLTCVDILHSGEGLSEVEVKHREHYWSMYLTCLESVVVALLVRRAFPAQEIRVFEQEAHLLLVHMELEKHHSVRALDSDSEDESGDEVEGEAVEDAAGQASGEHARS